MFSQVDLYSNEQRCEIPKRLTDSTGRRPDMPLSLDASQMTQKLTQLSAKRYSIMMTKTGCLCYSSDCDTTAAADSEAMMV
jgi:hypothetical protein